MSFYGMIHLLKNKVHFQDWRTIVHHGESEVNGDNYQLTQPISITVEIGLKKSVHIPGMRFSITFDDLKLISDVMDRVKCDFHNRYFSLYNSIKSYGARRKCCHQSSLDSSEQEVSYLSLHVDYLHWIVRDRSNNGLLLRYTVTDINMQYTDADETISSDESIESAQTLQIHNTVLCNESNTFSFSLEFTPEISYYNVRNALFEPFLEPSRLIFQAVQGKQYDRNIRLSFDDTSMECVTDNVGGLRLNLSDAAIEVLARSYAYGCQSFQGQNNSTPCWESIFSTLSINLESAKKFEGQDSQSRIRLILKNNTGVSLKFRLSSKKGSPSSSSSIKLPILPENQISLAPISSTMNASSSVATLKKGMVYHVPPESNHDICVSSSQSLAIKVQNGEEVKGVKCDRIGTMIRRVRFQRQGLQPIKEESSKITLPIRFAIDRLPQRNISISSTVTLSNLGYGFLECGVRFDSENGVQNDIECVGTTPLALPIHYFFEETPFELFVRPPKGSYHWSKNSLLRYSRINSSDVFHWTFMHNMLVCLSMDSYCSDSDESEYKNSIMFFAKAQITDDFVDVKICPSLSIRNLLPLPIEFQICNREKYNADKNKDVPIQMIKLDPGECSDISEGAVRNSVSDQCGLCIHRWLKLGMRGFWSDRWIEVKFDGETSQQNEDGTISSDNNTGIPDYGIQNRSATIPFYNGSQYRVGIKLLPKHDFPSLEDKNISKAFVSIEVIIFADVWIKDLTNLDLIVGTPPPLAQEGFNVSFGSDAEAAILELTNVLEGRKLNEMNSQSNILPLPNQTAGKVIDEVFEYIEIGTKKSPLSQLIKRRWYATERHDCAAVNPKEFILPEENDRSVWKWDGPWTVDLQGANLAEGGWESANAVDTWNPKRIFSSRENFRRRRWRRSRSRARTVEVSNVDSELEVVAHHSNINQKVTGIPIALKLGDGSWSPTFQCSESGIVRVLGMKWRALNTARSKSRQSLIYDLCYVSSPISGIWGEFTNILSITPRILIRNNSEVYSMEIKQVGDIDEKLVLNPGKSAPFFWSSLKGPELICIRPFHYHGDVESHIPKDIYFWSGGIDPCNLGITALRVRTGKNSVSGSNELRTIRANISIRPRSHNTGIDITLKEEAADGTGALFRIENRTPFPLWTAQEGLMANPSSLHSFDPNSESTKDLIDQINLEMAGDCVSAGQSVSFGLDDPSRQVKHGRGSTYLRVALAPLRTRDGLATTKLIKLKVGDDPIHMKPSQLSESLDHAVCEELLDTKVLGVVVADGPTRVVRFCLIYKDVPASQVLSYAAKRQAKRSEAYLEAMGLIKSTVNPSDHKLTMEKMTDSWIKDGALKAIELKISNSIPNDSEAIEYAKTNTGIFTPNDTPTSISFEFRYNVRISLPEVLLSLIDQEPSEVAVLTLQSINMLSKWNQPQNEGVVITISVGWVQIDNHCPNAPFPVALVSDRADDVESNDSNDIKFPALAINVDFTRKRINRMTCIRNITVVSSNIAMGIDLSFLARLQRYFLGILDWIEQAEEEGCVGESDSTASWIYADTQQIWPLPKMQSLFNARKLGHSESSEIFFERLTIFPCCISFSVTPSRSLSSAEAKLEGPGAAAIHTAVRKGDLRFTANSGAGLLGVKIGRTNRSTLAVVRGIFKSIFVDALLRCEEASIALPGIRIQNYLSTVPQVTTYMLAHYLTALRSNVPSLIFSLAAFGNPSGLIRGLGDGVADFVTEPYKGLKKSLEELDPTFVIDGVARGTGSLARRAIGGVADSASLLTQTLSKNMAVLSLDRKYAQKRDRTVINQSSNGEAPTLIDGLGSGSAKLIKGVYDGVSGVVRAPIRGAEKSGAEGFAKGVGKGLLGLVVKPVVGLSDAATDIMIGVKGSVEGGTYSDIGRKVDTMKRVSHLRTRRVFYGKHRIMRNYKSNDSIAAQLMMNTRLAGEHFSSCVDMGDRGVILLSVNRLLVLVVDQNNNSIGKETACCIKYRNIAKLEARQIPTPDKVSQWSVVFLLKNPRKDGSEVEVIACADRDVADELYGKILHACSEKYLTLTHSKKF